MTHDLSKRVALVTGASRGLGAAMAKKLGACGARVAVNYFGSPDKANRVVDDIRRGGGVKGGITHGATDELGYNAVDDVVHVHDLHATMLHLLGVEHKKLTFKFQGRDFRLTDVHGNVVQKILA